MRKIINIVKEYEYNEEKDIFLLDNDRENSVVIYKYNELSDNAKEEAKKYMLDLKVNDYIYNDLLEENILNELQVLFPASDLKVQYSLSSCQGDGLNIYGNLDLKDMYNLVKNELNEEDKKYIKWLLNDFDNTYKLEYNNRYCYCICDRQDITDNILYDLEIGCYRRVKEDIIDKFNKLGKKYLVDLCNKWENYGYEFLYELSDNDIENYIDNGIMFLENGKIYN